jgi:hypothetical protein
MKVAHRTWHRRIWIVIGPAVLLLLMLAILARPSLFPDRDHAAHAREVTP